MSTTQGGGRAVRLVAVSQRREGRAEEWADLPKLPQLKGKKCSSNSGILTSQGSLLSNLVAFRTPEGFLEATPGLLLEVYVCVRCARWGGVERRLF